MSENRKKDNRKTTGVSIRAKLLFWLLLIALVPMAVLGAVSYSLSSNSLEKQSLENLQSTLALQKNALEDYFSERTRNLENLVDDVQIIKQQEFAKMAAIKNQKQRQINEFFAANFRDISGFAASPQQQAAITTLSSPASSEAARKEYSPFYGKWLKDRAFDSIIMVAPNGSIIFSNDDVVKSGTSLQDKSNTPELAAFKKGENGPSFTDFTRSSLRDNKAAAYFSVPVTKGSLTLGVMLFHLPNDAFDKIMQDAAGLGETGEIYLVGPDGMFRSNSRYYEEETVLNPSFLVDTESVAEGLAEVSGERVIVNYRGTYVLSSYMPVEAAGATWALIVEIDQVEAMTPKRKGEEKDYFAAYADRYGYPDLYMLEPDGYIFYSAAHHDDYRTNILSGEFKDSAFADTVDEVLERKEMVVSDISRYQPAGNSPAAFLAMPFLQDNHVSMIVALRIPIAQINAIMKTHGGIGETGDSYLVGPDKLWRTESLQTPSYNVTSTLLNPELTVDTKPVQEALAGNSGTGITANGRGDTVLASWKPFAFHDLRWAIVNEVNQAEISKPVTKLLNTSSMVAAAGVAAVLLLSFLVSGGITRQVGAIMGAMSKVEDGDYDTRAEVVSKDELGTMASSFNEMIDTTKGLIKSRQEEHDQLQESIMGLLMEISELSDGDMTIRATVREDATGTVADSLNMMLEELHLAISKIKKSSEQVGATASELSSSTDKLAIRSDSQSELISGAVEEINRMTRSIEQAADQANKSADTSELSRTAATEGTRAVQDTSQAMEAIRGNVQNTARAIKRLGESSQEISDFAKTINDISDRTSILALNASIQAAAAGEEGRGFGVVAEEIQRLAERAAGSTRQIDTLIRNILGEITDAGASMDSSIEEVVRGTKLSEDALAKLMDINRRSSEVAELIGAVSLTTGEQAQNSVRVAKTMGEIGVISMEAAKETRMTSSSMQDMASVADEMLQSVAIFKLGDEEPAPAWINTEETNENNSDEAVNLASLLHEEGGESGQARS
ncbi:MAG: methyl-accepting chemotaxis protein [Thermodesulfobacteriota bacterium]